MLQVAGLGRTARDDIPAEGAAWRRDHNSGNRHRRSPPRASPSAWARVDPSQQRRRDTRRRKASMGGSRTQNSRVPTRQQRRPGAPRFWAGPSSRAFRRQAASTICLRTRTREAEAFVRTIPLKCPVASHSSMSQMHAQPSRKRSAKGPKRYCPLSGSRRA